jgi:hypothetical protein
MELMLRYLQAGAGHDDASETEASADQVLAGSSPQAAIHLIGRDIRPLHARFSMRGKHLRVEGCGGTILVNGTQVRAADLAPGARVSIGRHVLRAIEAPQGFDAALEIRLDPAVEPAEFEAAFRTDLSQTFLSRRRSAWAALAGVLVLCLAMPLDAMFVNRAGGALPAWLPSDRLWSPGPLIHAHQVATRDACMTCHRVPFVRVRDHDCKSCHKRVFDHVTAARAHTAGLAATQRCATCHREHYSDPSHFVPRSEQFCTDCHGRNLRFSDRAPLEPVRAFAKDKHPQFRIELVRLEPGSVDATGTTQWTSQSAVLVPSKAMSDRIPEEPCRTEQEPAHPSAGEPEQSSNLTFSHACHLDARKVSRPGATGALGCSDCHVLSVDGSHFVPLSMSVSCEGSGCHSLEFAREKGLGRELPHGKPAQAIAIIQDFFVKKAAAPPGTTAPPRHLPNRVEPPPCTGSAYDCGLSRARFEVELAFVPRDGTCRLCHVVTDTGAASLVDRFRVTPVRLQAGFFKSAHFDHRAHEVQGKLTGDKACEACHAARNSTRSADVMIPPIGKCLECHSDRPEKDKVTVSCPSCHVYHPRRSTASVGEEST